MKSIELTHEHKVKLMTMCNELFPEYRWQISGLHLMGFTGGSEFPNVIIHWFEFCMINLFDALFKKGYINAPAFYTAILGKTDHPVDYLYEEFEKLIKNKQQ